MPVALELCCDKKILFYCWLWVVFVVDGRRCQIAAHLRCIDLFCSRQVFFSGCWLSVPLSIGMKGSILRWNSNCPAEIWRLYAGPMIVFKMYLKLPLQREKMDHWLAHNVLKWKRQINKSTHYVCSHLKYNPLNLGTMIVNKVGWRP